MLQLDFYYRGIRCREQTALADTPDNRRRVEALMRQIDREIRHGTFVYTRHFPDSPRAALFDGANSGIVQPRLQRGSCDTAMPTGDASPTFGDHAAQWLHEMRPQWRRLHHADVCDILEGHLLPKLRDRPVATIDKATILDLRAKLAEAPGRSGRTLSASRINKVMGVFRQCMTAAIERHDLADPFRGVRRLKARRPDIQPFTLDEVNRIVAAAPPDWRNYLVVRFFTGMRTGEVDGLRWSNVDSTAGVIRVRETYTRGEVENNAKSEMSIRDIPMLAPVRQALLSQARTAADTTGYVFASAANTPIDAHNFCNRVWYPLLKSLGLARRRPYQTRHTAATLMLAAGENPEWIARVMGHANTQMLFTVYSRYVPNLTRRDGSAIDRLLVASTPRDVEAGKVDLDAESGA